MPETRNGLARLPLPVKITIGYFAVLLILMGIMQSVTVMDFEQAVALGFQEDDPNSADRFERGRTFIEQGTAAADLVIQGLFCIGAIVGLSRRRAWGLACAYGQIGITVYWPSFDFCQESYLAANGFLERLDPGIVAFEVVFIVMALVAGAVLYRNRQFFST